MNKLAKLREGKSMIQADVAEALAIDRSTVAKWETGEAYPRTDKLPILAKLYGCTIDELFQAMIDQSA